MASDEFVIDHAVFESMRKTLGADFVRILGYFIEDGTKAVADIEAAFRAKSAAQMVRPAHTLKSEARQFGAIPLGDLAYEVEMGARRCVERQEPPEDLLVYVAQLRKLLAATLEVIDRETNPLQKRVKQVGFGRKDISGSGF